jgi:uncharacterized protein YjbI with pentapeptide repeats
MANEEHLKILKEGVEVWNRWREENPDVRPDLGEANLRQGFLRQVNLSGTDLGAAGLIEADLSQADLSEVVLSGAELRWATLREADLSKAELSGADLLEADLSRADLSEVVLSGADLSRANLTEAGLNSAFLEGADFSRADLSGADLSQAHLRQAHLREANLRRANLREADLRGAHLREVDLSQANLSQANLSGAHLTEANLGESNLGEADLVGARLIEADLHGARLIEADLTEATLIQTNFAGADLAGCYIYGVSTWNLNLEGANQTNLIISNYDEPIITLDNLEVAQFIYLLLHNEKIRHIIDTITSKVVLIMGRFTPERKAILDAIREELRRCDYLPILFDFEKPSSRDLTETISTLAHMARFVIADVTAAKSIPAELERIVPGLPSVPVQPLIATSDYEYALFEHIRRYPWVLDTYQYDSPESLLVSLKERVIDPAESKAKELTSPPGRALLSAPPDNPEAPTP